MSNQEEIEMHVRFLLSVRGTALATSHGELVQHTMNKTGVKRTVARQVINGMVRDGKLKRTKNTVSLPD